MNLQSILSEREKLLKEIFKDLVVTRGDENHLLSFHAETARLVYESALSAVQEAVEGKKRRYVTQPVEYKGSDANVWREGYNTALSSVSERIGELRKKV